VDHGQIFPATCRLTVPHRLGTMKSLGSLSVNAIRLRNVSAMSTNVLPCRPMVLATAENALKSCLGHGYSPAVQVLLQTLVEFCKPPKLQLGH
jgi:hypothetical protein